MLKSKPSIIVENNARNELRRIGLKNKLITKLLMNYIK